ncbi:hypothetical protein AXG93_2646s1080 [Marchantia polymorpha subsp. ruderalis]|uniref:Pectinesterase n=1 Tax=Marchantia polymorpha subsp. ruderalis TaxID=1480154 RepID=A0A176W7A0_MARPO|nr:hypothetical protein AXG93_2646s1080 [Marchantia polymorpha subsp. ruderalis]
MDRALCFLLISVLALSLLVFHVHAIFNEHAPFHGHVDFQNGEEDFQAPTLSPRSTDSPNLEVANVEYASGDDGSEAFTFAAPKGRKLWKRNHRIRRGRRTAIYDILDSGKRFVTNKGPGSKEQFAQELGVRAQEARISAQQAFQAYIEGSDYYPDHQSKNFPRANAMSSDEDEAAAQASLAHRTLTGAPVSAPGSAPSMAFDSWGARSAQACLRLNYVSEREPGGERQLHHDTGSSGLRPEGQFEPRRHQNLRWGIQREGGGSPQQAVHYISRITFENSAPAPNPGAENSQAVAFLIGGDAAAFYECSFLGAQDTLYDYKGRHYYYKCFIQGSIDFIFGNGRTLFQDCTLSIIAKKFGAVAAQQNQSSDEEPEFVFIGCYVNGTGSVYLGRAWSPYAFIIFANSYFENVINPEGWSDFGDPKRRSTAYFGLYENSGPGAAPSRLVPWSKNLTVDEVEPYLGQNYVMQWLMDPGVDAAYPPVSAAAPWSGPRP